jgi:phytoene synthase
LSPDEYCEEKAAASGSSFYQSFVFLPPDMRRGITALYAFCREVDDVVDECRDPNVARIKLGWWRQEVARLYAGQAQHPVTRALAPFVAPAALPHALFLEIIDGMQMDLDQAQYPDLPALLRYCYHAASTVGLLSARLFGCTQAGTLAYAHDLGLAFQLTNIIRDVREDALRGRLYLPQDWLERHGVGAAQLTGTVTPPALQALLTELAGTAEQLYQSAFAKLPPADRWAQRAGLIMAAIYHRLLENMRANGFRVLERRPRLHPLHKLWLAWRTLRRESRFRHD